MKILLYDLSPYMGGSIRSGVALINGLLDRGDDVGLIASRHDLFAPLVAEGTQFFHVEWEGFKNLFETDNAATKIRLPVISQMLALRKLSAHIAPALERALKDFAPDIIHLNQFNMFSTLMIQVARKAGIPCVMHGREIRLYGRREIRLLSLVERCVCVSTEEKENLVRKGGFAPEKLTVVFNGVDLQAFNVDKNPAARENLGLPHDAKVACILGRVIPWKGQDIAIEAWNIVRQRVPGAILIIVGSGTEEYVKTCMDQVKRAGLEDAVRFLGSHDDVSSVLSACDLVIHASRYSDPKFGPVEAFGRVVIEAMAAGLPVVATRAGGVLDIVLDGVTGKLVTPDDAKEMAEAIIEYLGNDQKALETGKAGRKRVEEEFSADMTTDAIRNVYCEVLEGR